MNTLKLLATFLAIVPLQIATVASAAGIDMDNPRRSLGREGDVRIDAQLLRETVSPGTPIGVTFQIQNLSPSTVAIANEETDASFDDESRTITVVVGSEIPPDGNMPRVELIAPGETRLFRAAAMPILNGATLRSQHGRIPRFVQVKVAILRNLSAFLPLIERQQTKNRPRLSDQQFDQWLESNDTIFLNAVPVEFVRRTADGDAERHGPSGGRN